jgi:Outer membrane protein beta-barrel domain
MKKLLILFCLLIARFASPGQSFNLGVTAGPNVSTFDPYNNRVGNYASSGITGFHAGLFAEVTWGNLTVQPGLQYASIGGETNYSVVEPAANGNGTFKYAVRYLQLPVNILGNIPITNGKIFLGGGPYMGFGLSGKITQTGVDNEGTGTTPYTSSTINNQKGYVFSKSDNPDQGINAVAGVRFNNKVMITLNDLFSLKFLSNYNGFAGLKSNVLSFSVGYAFF